MYVPSGSKFPRLQNRIEHTEVRDGVGTSAGNPLPIPAFCAMSPSTRQPTEPAFADTPVDQKVLDEERGHDHTHPVVHPPCALQLTHAGINEWVSGQTLLPSSMSAGSFCHPISIKSGRNGACANEGTSQSRWAYQSRHASCRTNAVRPLVEYRY